MRVPVDMDDRTFWKLSGIAEQFDMRVDEYLAELALVASKRALAVDDDPVVMRWREGLTDKEIGRALVLTNAQVARRRHQYGLPANRAAKQSIKKVS